MTVDRDWMRTFADKVCSPAQAILRVQPGARIFIGSGAAEPMALVEALVQDGGHLRGN